MRVGQTAKKLVEKFQRRAQDARRASKRRADRGAAGVLYALYVNRERL